MQTADFNVDDFTERGTAEADKGLLVKFEIHPMEDKVESSKQGRPIFTDVERIDIRVPGQRASIVNRKATFADKARFPEHYKKFRARIEGAEDVSEGTPLAQYPAISRNMVEELAFFNVTTVEHLASISDAHIDKFPNGNKIKSAAQEWLDRAENDGTINELKAELKAKDERLAALEAKMEALMEEDEEPAPKKKRRAKPATE